MDLILLSNTYKDVLSSGNDSLDSMTAGGYEILNGFYHVLIYIGGFGIIIGLLLVAISLISGNSRERIEGKDRLTSLLFWGIVMFACGGFCSVIYLIAATFTF